MNNKTTDEVCFIVRHICTILTTPQRTKRCAEHLPAGDLNEASKLRISAMPMFTVPESSPGKLNRLHAGASCFKKCSRKASRSPPGALNWQRCGHHELLSLPASPAVGKIKAALLAHCAVYPADNTPARLKKLACDMLHRDVQDETRL